MSASTFPTALWVSGCLLGKVGVVLCLCDTFSAQHGVGGVGLRGRCVYLPGVGGVGLRGRCVYLCGVVLSGQSDICVLYVWVCLPGVVCVGLRGRCVYLH